ncbi:polysaccharide biosynthesis/export family protein, partial [Acinetobacter baumannii]
VLLSACSNGAKNQQVAAAAAARDAEWKSPPPYILRPGDEIEVKFFYVPTMHEREFIREDGKLVLPLLNTPMKVSGLSVEELHNRLIAAYSD